MYYTSKFSKNAFGGKSFTYQRLKRQASELFSLSVKKSEVIKDWIFTNGKKEEKVQIGYIWDPKVFPVTFKTTLKLDKTDGSSMVCMDVWTGGESLVKIDGKPFGEINPHHRFLDITKFCDGSEHDIEIESVPKGLFGQSNLEPRLERAYLVVFDRDILKSFRRFDLVVELFDVVDEYLQEMIYNSFEKALGLLKIPSSTQEYLKRIMYDPTLANLAQAYVPLQFKPEGFQVLDPDVKRSIIEAAEFLMKEMEEIARNYKPPIKIYAMGHAHIDYAWLWPLKETMRKFIRTFANSLRMMEKYEDFRFLQSSSAYYDDLKKLSPEMFEKVKEKVKEGKWELIGGSVVEFDSNATSGESLVRQFLKGQKFFEREFGQRCKVGFLPDAFGFTWALPQIMKQAGIDYFVTTKIGWNDKNDFPYSWFTWRGIDGSEVIVHLYMGKNGYNSPLTPADIKAHLDEHIDNKCLVPFRLLTFGFGDGGGGPTDEMMDIYKEYKKLPGVPEVEIKKFHDIFEEAKLENLPVWEDELYLEFHRGTYTNQSIIKKYNRLMENKLYLAEVISTLDFMNGGDYPVDVIDRAWDRLLKSHFHDVLPGSSIAEVYREFGEMLEESRKELDELIKQKMEKFTEKTENNVSIFNPTNLNLPVILRNVDLKEGNYDNRLFVQNSKDGRTYAVTTSTIDAFSSNVFEYSGEISNANTDISTNTKSLENSMIKVEVKDDGGVMIKSKEFDRELFKETGMRLVALRDIPPNFDGWEIAPDSEKKVYLVPKEVELLDAGPATASISLKYEFEGSSINQIVRIYKATSLIDVHFDIDWHTRRYLLKLELPVDVLSREATYEIAFGNIKRKTTRNTSYEMAKFEVPYHRWLDISEEDFGVSVLNDSKYGCSVENSTIGLSIVRGAVAPDFFSDEGEHHLTFSILPHSKDWKLDTIKHAILLNTGMLVSKGKLKDFAKTLKEKVSFFEDVVMSALKKAEDTDDVVLRFYEPSGKRAKLKFRVDVELLNLLEDTIGKIDANKKIVFKPFEFKTFKLKK